MNDPVQIISLDELKDTELDVWVDDAGLHLAPLDEEEDEQ